MLLRHLSLSHFRNIAQLETEFPQGSTILTGANAQGKTSLLEAVYLFTGASSPHASSDRQMIRFDAPDNISRLVGRFDDDQTIEIRLIADEARLRKEVLIDRQKKRAVDLAGGFVAVLFLPQDMNVIEGSPRRRRKLIDSTLTQASLTYGQDLRKFRRIMTQRNALLKRLQERSASPEELDYWDQESSTRDRLEINYEPAVAPSEGSFIDRIHASFKQQRAEEIMRGISLVGPHRDEISLQLDQIALREYGSRGQIRTAMLALKLAEIQWLKAKSGKNPVLLMDEVMSELDPSRRRELLRELRSSPQAILTTSDLQMIDDEFRGEASIWMMEGGRVRDAF
jgi:DNA replication and repair protein RecF